MVDMNIDRVLARLNALELQADLDGIEERVLARILSRPTFGSKLGATMCAATFALIFGVMSATFSASEVTPTSLAPLGAPGPFAPSSLLMSPR